MSYPITYKNNGVLKIMSTEEFSTFAQAVLEHMAENDGPGALSFDSEDGDEIGSVIDTVYEDDIGGSNTTVNSNVIYLYQNLSIPIGDEPPRVLLYNDSNTPLKLTSDVQIDDLANSILSWGLTNEGPGSYQIATAAPDDGGTWSNVGSITEIYSGTTTNTVNLYKKLSSGTYTLERPLTFLGDGTIKKLTDEEITYFSKKVRERIVATGIGQYLLQSELPEEGTWVAKGSVIDTRATEGELLYTGSFAGVELYTGESPLDYTGVSDSGYFTGEILYQTEVPFAGPLNYSTDTYFIGDSFIGPGIASYVGPTISFTGTAGYTLILYYVGPDVDRAYGGPGSEVGPYTGPGGFYQGGYAGPSEFPYANQPSPAYVGPAFYARNTFTSVVPVNYVGPLTPYTLTSLYQVPGYYIGTVNYTITPYYTGAVTTNFLGPGYYTGSIPTDYTGQLYYTGLDNVPYDFPANYTGNILYVGPATYVGLIFPGYASGTYLGVATYAGPNSFQGPTPRVYTGANQVYTSPSGLTYLSQLYTGIGFLTYLGPQLGSFTGPRNYLGPETAYVGPGVPANFIGTANYTNELFPYAGLFFYVGPGFYLGDAPYQGLGPAYFLGPNFPYEGPIAVPYSGLTDTVYTLDVNYDTNYTINIIEDFVTNVETTTLWRRIA